MERWLHIGSLDMKNLLNESPEVGGPWGPPFWSLLGAHPGPEPLPAGDPVGSGDVDVTTASSLWGKLWEGFRLSRLILVPRLEGV